MITTAPTPHSTAGAALRELRGWHRPLMIMVLAMAGLTVAATVGLLVDDREVLNESIWLKPWKFGTSFVLYGLTLGWLLSRLDRRRRVLARIGWWSATLLAVSGMIDVGFVALQAARGTFSHFNTQTDLITVVGLQVFQVGVIALFLADLVLVVALLLQRPGDAPLRAVSTVGLVLAFAGMAVAFVLAGQGGQHEVVDAYGRQVTLGASHSIGVAPGGSGLPIVGWSTTGGDLRVPHFFGMHAIHLLLGLLILLAMLARRFPLLTDVRTRARLLAVAGAGCTGVFVLLTVQAARGESVIAPDPQMVALTAALLLGCGLAAALVLARTPPAVVIQDPAAAPVPEVEGVTGAGGPPR